MSLAVVAHTCNPDTQEEDLCESEISQDYNSSSRSTIFDPQLQPKEREAGKTGKRQCYCQRHFGKRK